jgi:hypothetical protein
VKLAYPGRPGLRTNIAVTEALLVLLVAIFRRVLAAAPPMLDNAFADTVLFPSDHFRFSHHQTSCDVSDGFSFLANHKNRLITIQVIARTL